MSERTLRVAWLVAVAMLIWTSTAQAENLTSAGGELFDIRETSGGELSNGTSDSYDGCYYLDVNGTRYRAPGAATVDGRYVNMATMTGVGGSLSVTRHAYVPASGGDWLRYFDTIENTGAGVVEVTVTYSGNLGSDGSTTTWGSSSGDTTVTPADFWFGTDDTDSSGDPSLAHLFHGEGGMVTPTTQTLSGDNLTSTFEITVGPGETVAFLMFAFQGDNQAAVRAEVEALVWDVAGATEDMDGGDLSLVVNFGLGGAPLVRWDPEQLFELPEGGSLELVARIEDREGDDYTVVWDLDNDGEFDDGDEESATVSAEGLDGPTTMTIGIMATDSEDNVSERHITLNVLNAPPYFTNEPEFTTVLIGQEWSFTPEVADPGGDEITVEVIDRPPGMVLLPDGGVRWEPEAEDVGERVISFLAVDDEDDPDVEGDGDALIEITLTVSENQRPGAPVIISPDHMEEVNIARPTFVVENPTDPEGDVLRLYFEVSEDDTYQDPIASGPQAMGADGTTSWTPLQDLDDGQLYNWRVWAEDAHIAGPADSSVFRVMLGGGGDGGPDGGPGDGGPDDDGGPEDPNNVEPGCSCQASGSNAGSAGLALALLALFVAIPRRKR